MNKNKNYENNPMSVCSEVSPNMFSGTYSQGSVFRIEACLVLSQTTGPSSSALSVTGSRSVGFREERFFALPGNARI